MKYTFEQFLKAVNYLLVKECGFDSEDLPDYCYYDEWKAGISPQECADNALEYAKGY